MPNELGLLSTFRELIGKVGKSFEGKKKWFNVAALTFSFDLVR